MIPLNKFTKQPIKQSTYTNVDLAQDTNFNPPAMHTRKTQSFAIQSVMNSGATKFNAKSETAASNVLALLQKN